MRFRTQAQMAQMAMPQVQAGSAGSTSTTAGSSASSAHTGAGSTSSSSTDLSPDNTNLYAPADVTAIWAPHVVAVGHLTEAYVRKVAHNGMAWAGTARDLLPKLSQLVGYTPGYTLSPLLQAAVTAGSGSPQQLQLFSLLAQGWSGPERRFAVLRWCDVNADAVKYS